jgi:hypothetical protein
MGSLLVLLPGVALAQGLSIEHKAVGCLVAGGYPKLEACFAPSAALARARVYFRAEAAAHWYYVDMAPDAACFAGVLPKPKLDARRVVYYLGALDNAFAEARTDEVVAVVVKAEADCPKDSPLAAFLKHASVKVGTAGGPLVPAGFAAAGILGAGASTAVVATAAVVGAGAAVAGGTAAAGGGGADTSTTTQPVTTTQPAATQPTHTTPPETSPPGPTPTTRPEPSPTTTTTLEDDPEPEPEPEPPGCNGDPKPTIAIASPADGAQVSGTITIEASASDNVGVTEVRFFIDGGALATDTTRPYRVSWDTRTVASGEHRIEAQAFDTCGNDADDDVDVEVANSLTLLAGPAAVTWTSRIDGAGARGQVVLNGTTSVFHDAGLSMASARPRPGDNRFEALLVQPAEGATTWRFRLGGSFEAGSLRVVAGDAAVVTADGIVFRLGGRAGERAVFTFRCRP